MKDNYNSYETKSAVVEDLNQSSETIILDAYHSHNEVR